MASVSHFLSGCESDSGDDSRPESRPSSPVRKKPRKQQSPEKNNNNPNILPSLPKDWNLSVDNGAESANEQRSDESVNFLQVEWDCGAPLIIQKRKVLVKRKLSDTKQSSSSSSPSIRKVKEIRDVRVFPNQMREDCRPIWFCPLFKSKRILSDDEDIKHNITDTNEMNPISDDDDNSDDSDAGEDRESNSDLDAELEALVGGLQGSSKKGRKKKTEKKKTKTQNQINKGKKKKKKRNSRESLKQRQLRLWNLPILWSEMDIRVLFETLFGRVERVQLEKLDSSVISQFAVLTFAESSSVRRALKYEGSSAIHPRPSLSDTNAVGMETSHFASSLEDGNQSVELRIAQARHTSAGVDKWLTEYARLRPLPAQLDRVLKDVDEFMHSYDESERQRHEDWKSRMNQAHRRHGYSVIREKDGWKRVHYPSKHLRMKNAGTDDSNRNRMVGRIMADGGPRKNTANIYLKSRTQSYRRQTGKFERMKQEAAKTNAARMRKPV